MDLSLNINGDASGAAAAFSQAGEGAGELGDAVGKSAVKWQELANIAKAAATAVVQFGVDSVRAYAESEKIQRQLVRASGEYAEALSEQAEALSRLYSVDDDVIKQSQVLLTQWGGVGAASKEVTEAALNLAAAFGGDVNTATEELIRNVESGGVGLAKLGIHFRETGDKGKDLAAAVAAINEKLGGAASSNAASLTGSLAGASLAFQDLQKDIGASITAFLTETGVINGVTSALRTLDEFITQKKTLGMLDEGLRQGAISQAKLNLAVAEQQLKELKSEGGSDTLIKMFQTDVDNAQSALDQLIGSAKSLDLPSIESVTGQTSKAMRGDGSSKQKSMAELNDKSLEEMKKYYAGLDQLEATAASQEENAFADSLAAEGKHVKDTIQVRLDGQKAYDDIRLSEEKKTAEHAEKLAQEEMKARDKASKESADRAEKQEQDWKNAGDQIGAAFVNALGDQLSKLAAGEEFDAALFVGDILASIISVAAIVIGTAYGQPALGAAVGNLAAMGVRAGAGAISADAKKKKMGASYHSGGWVGDEAELPRHHSGAWIAPDEQQAILQHGERVLSRSEVASMGGPRGVDSAAKGGRMGINVSVMAIDAKNAAEGFVGNLGLGMKRALRSGQGDVPRLLGMSPR